VVGLIKDVIGVGRLGVGEEDQMIKFINGITKVEGKK
jgi:hypothetical protein